MAHLDLRFPLATRSPVGTSPFCFSCPFVFSSGHLVSFCWLFPGFYPLLYLVFFLFLRLLPRFVPLSLSLVGVVHSAFLCFSFRYAFLVQLAFCRTLSTRVNYQEQWTVYHEWCCRLGHTVSRPSIPTVAHFFFASFAVSLFFLHRLLLLDVDCGVSLCSSCLVLSLCS